MIRSRSKSKKVIGVLFWLFLLIIGLVGAAIEYLLLKIRKGGEKMAQAIPRAISWVAACPFCLFLLLLFEGVSDLDYYE